MIMMVLNVGCAAVGHTAVLLLAATELLTCYVDIFHTTPLTLSLRDRKKI